MQQQTRATLKSHAASHETLTGTRGTTGTLLIPRLQQQLSSSAVFFEQSKMELSAKITKKQHYSYPNKNKCVFAAAELTIKQERNSLSVVCLAT